VCTTTGPSGSLENCEYSARSGCTTQSSSWKKQLAVVEWAHARYRARKKRLRGEL